MMYNIEPGGELKHARGKAGGGKKDGVPMSRTRTDGLKPQSRPQGLRQVGEFVDILLDGTCLGWGRFARFPRPESTLAGGSCY